MTVDDYYGKKLCMKPTSGDSSNIIFNTGNKSLNAFEKRGPERNLSHCEGSRNDA